MAFTARAVPESPDRFGASIALSALGNDISPFGRELLQLRREMEEAGEGWTDEEIEEFLRSRSGE